MTEILTESFCERCGTRYTFESARPKTRLTGVKVLSRGLKNFVMSDDTSMDEAMAAARSETDREQTSHQLDAFHKTFNFCMSCRQYTCPNCWNDVEARCLSCAPHLGHEVLPAPFPDLPSGPLVSDPAALGDPFASNDGLTAANGTNGAAKSADLIGFAEVQARRDEEVDAAARLAALTAAPIEAPAIEPEPLVAQPEPLAKPEVPPAPEVPAASAAPVAEPLTPVAPLPADAQNPYDDVDPSTPTWLKALVVGSAVDEAPAVEQPAVERQVAAAPPVAPERTIEPEPVVVEPEPVVVEPEAAIEPVATKPEPVVAEPEPEPVVVEPEAAIEPVATEPEPIVAEAVPPVVAEPAPPVEITPEPEPEPVGVASEPIVEPTPEPVAPAAPFVLEPAPAAAPTAPVTPAPDLAAAATATPAEDVISQPVWQIVAPDDATTAAAGAAPAARPEPQWPAQPQWPERTAAAGLPFLNRPATPTGGLDALWAESTREVVASPSKNGKPANVVQPCVNCGLSLSANARFCRRCGTPQGS